MEDILPNIAIAIDVEPQLFLDRMAAVVAEANLGYTSRPLDYSVVGRLALGLDPTTENGITGQLLIDPQTPTQVQIQVQNDWNPDPPSYEQYIAAVRELLYPLLQAYSQTYGTPLQLDIQSKADTEPVVPPSVQRFFSQFVTAANVQIPHPKDWERWYQFIRGCHANEVMLDEQDVVRLLFNVGFIEEKAHDLANVYAHGRAILALGE